MNKQSFSLAAILVCAQNLLGTLSPCLAASSLPPLGAREYLVPQKTEQSAALEIKAANPNSRDPAPYLKFRDPTLSLSKETRPSAAPQTPNTETVTTSTSHGYRHAKSNAASGSVMSFKPLHIIGKYKEPSLAFPPMPIHLQEAEPHLNLPFSHEIPVDLPVHNTHNTGN